MLTMKLIVNADDFGYSRGVNFGIIDSYQKGIVTSTTMMMNMPAMEHAFELAKENPGLGVGIHLVLTCGSPIRDDVPSLVNEKGEFHHIREIFSYAEETDIEREFSSQIERFLSTGYTPTHIDSHHHVHTHELVLPIVLRLAERYHLPVRKFTEDPLKMESFRRVKSTDLFLYDFYGDHLTYEMFEQLLSDVKECQTVEMMCHPAYLDTELLTGSSYALPRAKEVSILTDPRAKEWLKQRNIELITFKEIG